MNYRLFAFDLDGTLLTTDKQLTLASRKILTRLHSQGAVVTLASGRLGSSIAGVAKELSFSPALLTLNGAAVWAYDDAGYQMVYSRELPARYADELLTYGHGKPFAVNYYRNGKLYSEHSDLTSPWIDLYFQQTRTECTCTDLRENFLGGPPPQKIIFVGAPEEMDRQEAYFRKKWGEKVYIVRTWTHYLEFLHPDSNKGAGLTALASHYSIPLNRTVAFGDADNDIPLVATAGLGVVTRNATPGAMHVADRISTWTNDEDAVARELEGILSESLSGDSPVT